jgi:hypothetical protein
VQGESFQGSSYAAGVPDQFNFLIAKVACLGAVPTGGPSVTMQQGFCFMSLQLSSPLYSLQSCLCSHASAVTPLQSRLCSHASAVILASVFVAGTSTRCANQSSLVLLCLDYTTTQ